MKIQVMMTEHLFYVKTEAGEYNARYVLDGHSGKEKFIVQPCVGNHITDDMRTVISTHLREKFNLNGFRKDILSKCVPDTIVCPRCGHVEAWLRRDEGDEIIQSDCHCPKCGYYEYRNTDREVNNSYGVYHIQGEDFGDEWNTVREPITPAYIEAFRQRLAGIKEGKAYLAKWDKVANKLEVIIGEYFE